MKKHNTKIRVRYGETDQMGVVHHGSYAQYFELARIEWFDKFGLSYRALEESGVMLPVYELNIKYRKPAVFDEVLDVETVLHEKPTAKIHFDYTIRNAKGEILTQAETILVFSDMKTKKPMRCPKYILERFGF